MFIHGKRWVLPALTLSMAVASGLTGCSGAGGGSNVRPSGSGSGAHNHNISFNGTTRNLTESIVGSDSLTKGGTGTLVILGSYTYTGGTTIKEGTLQIGNGGDEGSIIGNVVNNGTLLFKRDANLAIDQLAMSGEISGSGRLVQAGNGVVTLTGTNTYTGGTTVESGVLQIGTGGSIVGDVVDEGKFAFDGNDDATFAGVISGSGSLEKFGIGTETLTGDSTFTGGTRLGQGVLEVSAGSRLGTGAINDVGGTLKVDAGVTFTNAIVLNSGALDNAGTLPGISDGAQVQSTFGNGGGARVLNHDGGKIEGQSLVIDLGTAELVSNDGSGSVISASDGVAIRLSEGGTVNNVNGGVISGTTAAIDLPVGGTVVNGAGSTIKVTGTGTSSIMSQGPLLLTNDGTIIGSVSTGVGMSAATLSAGSSIQGDLDLGADGSLTQQSVI